MKFFGLVVFGLLLCLAVVRADAPDTRPLTDDTLTLLERSLQRTRFPGPILQQLCQNVEAQTIITSAILSDLSWWKTFQLYLYRLLLGSIADYPWLQPVIVVLILIVLMAGFSLSTWVIHKLVTDGSAKISEAIVHIIKAKADAQFQRIDFLKNRAYELAYRAAEDKAKTTNAEVE